MSWYNGYTFFFLKYLSYLFPSLFLELQVGYVNHGLISVAREEGRKKL